MTQLTSEQLDALRAVCDTVVPSIAVDEDPDGFWARSASELGVAEVAAGVIATLPEAQGAGLQSLLEAFFQAGIAGAPLEAREQLLAGVAASSVEAGAGVGALVALTLYLHYGLPDANGQNPKWRTAR